MIALLRRGRHTPRYLLYRRPYILMRDWDSAHQGWWRLSWPSVPQHPHHIPLEN